ncbi:MAG: hypothetical protein IJI53_07235 [Clostridia bacterium]|nr:hypothetical protein [Clostridia bacterium]MBR0407812.1 hypothetical protein [Clostridia bacterium]
MPDSEAKKAWVKEHTTRIVMNLNHNTDADILQQLSKVESKQGYIKQLIRKEIEANAGPHRTLDDLFSGYRDNYHPEEFDTGADVGIEARCNK